MNLDNFNGTQLEENLMFEMRKFAVVAFMAKLKGIAECRYAS